jgi:lipopolysaccharide/colanic/teichoic acid biosynthesis glycosyltransferase/glycosyltransferase involved in cell wall biosynthesis
MSNTPLSNSNSIRVVDDIVVAGERRSTFYERRLKRPIDVVGAVVLILITAPLAAFVALGVRITLGRPVVFRQTRVTKGAQNFTMLKFRSMRPEDRPLDDGQYHAPRDDPRHTRFGQTIRRLSLDELPQLWNVLRGDMSLIGPRPELPAVVKAFELDSHPRHLVRAGMTGPWQISEYRDGYVHMNVHVDAEYVGDLTLRRDIGIVFRTIGLFFGLGHEALPSEMAMPPEMRPASGEPLRVLHVLEPSIAGVPAYVEKLGRELSDRGIEQVVLTSDTQTWDFADWPTRVIRRPWKRSPGDAKSVAKELRKVIEEEKIDLVHAHATFAGVATRLRKLNVPVIYQPHGWGHLSTRRKTVAKIVQRVERRLDRRTHTLLTLSDHEAAEAPRARRAERVRPIVDLTGFEPMVEFDRRAARLELGWARDERIHVCIGELNHRKNQLALASAWKKHAGDADRLVFIGDGKFREPIEALCSDRIQLLGWRKDVGRLMAAADALVVPSLGEGFSLVILEALATGLPVFSTSIGGTEIIASDDGRVVTTPEEVVRAAISSRLLDGTYEDRLARARRHQTAASLETVADEFIEIYARAVGRERDIVDLRDTDESNQASSLRPYR